MQILLVHNSYQEAGGEDQVFRAEAAMLEENGHQVTTFERSNAELAGKNPFIIAANTVWSRQSSLELHQLLKEHKPDIVHFHNTFLSISPAAYYVCKSKGIPVVQTLHNYRLLCPVATFFRDGQVCEDCLGKGFPWPGVTHACWRGSHAQTAVVATMLGVHRALGTWTSKVDRYIALTEFARRKFIEGGLPAERIAVKPNFTQMPSIKLATKRENFALYVGRLTEVKGITTLLDAWQHIDHLKLKIVGDGELAPTGATPPNQSSQHLVSWLGGLPHDQVLDLMEKSKFLIFPSMWYEGMPNTIIEAFSRGLPVIASRLGAMATMVRDKENGLLFEPGNARSLRKAVEWAEAHPEALKRMGATARLDFETRYNQMSNYPMLMEIYEQAKEQASNI